MSVGSVSERQFNVKVSANIALGEVHEKSGLEGAKQAQIDERVKEWLGNGEAGEFVEFANAMGCPKLLNVAKQMQSLGGLKDLVEGTTGMGISRLDDLVAQKNPPMHLFYCTWQPADGGTGHATNVSVAYDANSKQWEVSFHNTGLGLKQDATFTNGEKDMCQCACTFPGLDDKQVKILLRGLDYIQKASNKEEYTRRCQAVYNGRFDYKDEHGKVQRAKNFPQPTNYAHNYTFMRAQVGGNCSYASLNAMMRYAVLKEHDALEAESRNQTSQAASLAVRMLDFYCRMKSMDEAFASIKTDDKPDPQKTRFLERILEANVRYFQKYIEKRCVGGGKESDKKLAEIRKKFENYRGEIHQARVNCGIAQRAGVSIETSSLQNTGEIAGALSQPITTDEVHHAQPAVGIDPALEQLNKALDNIRGLVAKGTQQATREAVTKLVQLCNDCITHYEGCKASRGQDYMDHVGNMIRSLILDEKFQVDIGEALKGDENLRLSSLEEYKQIANFLCVLKEKNGKSSRVIGKFETNETELCSIDEQNMMLTLQAQSLQIYRELAKRRNVALRGAHPDVAKLATNKLVFDPNELVIDVPELKAEDHCYDKRTVDRRNALRKFSYSGSPDGKFIVGSDDPEVPKSAKDVFDSLLSGKDHGELFRALGELKDQVDETSSFIDKEFEELKAIKVEITKAEKKKYVLEQLNIALQALQKQLGEISKLETPDKAEKPVDEVESLGARKKQLVDAIEQIKAKIAEVEKWPGADKVKELEAKRGQIEANIKTLVRLLALQKAAQAEFCSAGGKAAADFKGNKMGVARASAIERLREYTPEKREASKKNAIKSASDNFNKKNNELGNHNPLVAEFDAISKMVEGALAEVKIDDQTVQKATCDAFGSHDDRQRELGSSYSIVEDCQIIARDDKIIAGDGANGPKFADVMTTDESDLGANWGQGLQIDESILPGFDISLSIKALKEVCQYGNRYARTVAGVVGYRQTQGNIFHGFISDTTATKWVETPTPYSVCGLGDLGQLVALNKMFQSLQERFQPKQTNLKADELKFKQGNSNMGAQFAPEDLGNAHPKISDPTHSFPNPAFDRVREIIDKDVREVERNELIAEVNSTSFEANLRKCAVTNPDNPLDSVISVLSVISADPHTLVNQLKIEADGGNQICTLVMGLLTSHKSRDAIANGIKTEEDAQELAEACTNFLNKTWLDSPTMRPFDAGIGDQKHVLTYNQERLRALAVSVTAMAEVLTMLGQVDGIDPSAKEAAQKALENILDRLNEEVLFKNVKNETPEAAAARKQIAQLKLYIASQQSKLVGGSQHLSAKWSANVIASLAECGDKTSGSLEFLDNLIGAELSRFRSEFAIGFSKHAAEDNGFFIQHTGSAAMDIIKHSHQPPETASASLAADQKKRPEVNYESSSQERAIKWNAAGMRLCEHTADGEEIICDLINGTSDITGKVQSNSNIDTLIDNERLCDEVCAYLGIKKDETVKCEKEGDITKIIPTSGLHKGKEFSIIAGNPPMFKNKDGHQLMTIAPEHMNHHLFKDHFCWGWQEVDGGKDCYEFCKHTGGQEVAYHAIKEVQTGSIKFAAGRPEKSEIESDKEIKFLNIGEIPGLSHLSKSGLSLDAIFNQQDETIELTALQHHGEPIKLKQEGGKWVLASNPNMQLITHAQFTDLLQGERQDGLGGTSTAGIENPMGYLGESRYLVFKESTTSLTSRNLLFLIPEEVKDEEEAKNLFDDKGEGKVNKDSPYGIFGRAEPSKPYFNEATLAVQSHFLRWSMDKVGRYSEFAIQESDNKAIAHTAITLIARAMREKNYAQALGFLNAIPKGLQLGKGAEDDTIRRMFFDIIRDDFDNTPEVATMHMQLFLKWFQMDTKVTESVWRFIADYNKSLPAGTQQISEEIFSKLIRDKFVRACRDEAFYSQSLALTSLQKQALLEKLPDDVFIKCDKYHWAVAKVLNEANRWREGQKEIVSAIIAKPVDMEPVSVVTRNKASEANVSDGERSAFSALRKHFAQLDPRPTQTKGDTLLDGEEQSSPFTFLGTEQRGESEGAILKGEFDRYDQEIDEGRKKALEETGFIPENAKLADTTRTDSVQKALEECDSELTQQKNDALEKLQELYKGIFSTHISAGEISRDNMMPVLVELMLNRGKPAVEAGEGSVTLDFPAQKMQVKMSRAQYKEFLETTRSYLLTTSILKKNELIKARLEELQGLQAKLTDNPVDGSLIAQTRAAYLALNREIAAQKELCGPDEPDKDFYGEVAEVVGGGITRDELMVYEVLSGIRPYVKQAELLKNLFEGKTKAFQLIMGGGKTAVLLSLFCFYISRQEKLSVPVILSHASQFESVVGNVGEYQRSRFNQDIMVLDVSREQLKDVDQLKQILENLQTAKAKHQVIVARTSLLNVLQLTFQELCNPSDRIKELKLQIDELNKQEYQAKTAFFDACRECDAKPVPKESNALSSSEECRELKSKKDESWNKLMAIAAQMTKLETELDQYNKYTQKFKLLRAILGFFKEETTGILDEADINLNVTEEVNFPSGNEEPISDTQLAAGASFFRHIAAFNKSKGNNFDLFGFSNNEQAMLSDTQFKEHQDLLTEYIWAEKISPDEDTTWGDFMEVREVKLEDFKKILRGESAGKEGLFNPESPDTEDGGEELEHLKEVETLERLAVFRGLMAELLPHTRNKSANRNYGFTIREVFVPAKDGGAPRIERKPVFVPYIAVGQPSQNEFGNPYEKMACFFMHAMHNETLVKEKGKDSALVFSNATGSARLLDLFFEKIKGKIELERALAADGVKTKSPLESVFREATGVDYSAFKGAIEKHKLDQSEEYNKLLGEVQEHLASNPAARLLIFEYVSDEFLRFHPSMTTSGSMQVAEMVGNCMACTGTVWNNKTWPTSLSSQLKQDVGTEGQILIKQKQDFKAGRAGTFVAKDANVDSFLETIADRGDLQDFRALIDTGGVFKASNAETVARQMLAWIGKKNEGCSENEKIDIKGVLFFRPHKDRTGGTYCIMSQDGTTKELPGTTQGDIKDAGFDPNKIAVYYDEARTVGTDVKFQPTAFAVQTVDPSSTSLRDLSQGSMRMRQLLSSQRVHVVCAKSHLEAKRKAEPGSGKTSDSFTFEEILKWGTENQAAKLKKQLMKAHKAKIDGILKDIILRVIQDGSTRYVESISIYDAFISFFRKDMQTDVLTMFTTNKATADGEAEIQRYYDEQVKKFRSVLEKNTSLPGRTTIDNLLETALGETDGSLVKALQSAKEDLKNEEFETSEHTFDANVEQTQEQEQEKQVEQQQEKQQEQEVDQDQDTDINYHASGAAPRVKAETDIDISIDQANTNFARFKTFESVSAREDLGAIETGKSFKSGTQIKNYGELLPANFHVSRNFMEVVDGDTHPLSPYRKEPTYFVLHIKEDGAHEFCVVSNEEAKTLRKGQIGDKTFLFDMNGTLCGGDLERAKTFNDRMENAINWIHFWHGDVAALQSASIEWINDNLRKCDQSKPTKRNNHEICCFRWLLSRTDHRNKANAQAKIEDTAKEVHKIFQSAGIVSELQTEAESLLAKLAIAS